MSDQQQQQDETPSCGKIKPPVESSEQSVVSPEGTTSKNAQGLQVMSEKDVNEYMATILEAKQPPPGLEKLEMGALASYKHIAQEQGNAERQLTRTQAQVEHLKSTISRLQGQSEAYVNLLVVAEDSRRAETKGRAN